MDPEARANMGESVAGNRGGGKLTPDRRHFLLLVRRAVAGLLVRRPRVCPFC
jgi:hypothetical protein